MSWWTAVTGLIVVRDGRSRRMTRPRKWQGVGLDTHLLICGGCQIVLTSGRRAAMEAVGYRVWVGGPPQDGGRYTEWKPWMKKRTVRTDGTAGPVHLAPMESNYLTQIQPIVAHCATCRYSDGSPRRPGWITVSTAGTSWVVTAKEPDAAAQLRVTGATLDEALDMLSLLLDSEDAPWEPDRFLASDGKKKK